MLQHEVPVRDVSDVARYACKFIIRWCLQRSATHSCLCWLQGIYPCSPVCPGKGQRVQLQRRCIVVQQYNEALAKRVPHIKLPDVKERPADENADSIKGATRHCACISPVSSTCHP